MALENSLLNEQKIIELLSIFYDLTFILYGTLYIVGQ